MTEPLQTSAAKHAGSKGNWNVVLPTIGGKQFWTDQFVFRDWRIQRNVYTKHCRLLDPRDFRQAWGSYSACLRKFEELKESRGIKPLSGKAVVLLHGLGRSRSSMRRLAKHLAQQDFIPINVGYASTRGSIKEHARALNRVISQLHGIDEIYFVGHSMGNIVFRYYLHEFTIPGTEDRSTVVQGDSRIKASVMIAPPNHGAYLARVLRPTGLFGIVTGQSGKELASDWSTFSENLATPNHPFGILAGKYNFNPLFRVDNDTTVSVEETRLAGAHDFRVVKSPHVTIMANAEVIQLVDRFFRFGCFGSEAERTPLEE